MAKGDYKRGDSKNIIVGAAALFIRSEGALEDPETADMPTFGAMSYKDTLSDPLNEDWRNVGYTQNGMTLTITPDFGEVEVDQLLDSAKIFKQGMEVMLNTTFAEATLENLLYAIAASPADLNADQVDRDDNTGLPDTYSGIRTDDVNGEYHGSATRTGIGASAPSASMPKDEWKAATAGYSKGVDAAGSTDGIDMLEINSGNLGECPIERALCAVGPGTGICEVGDEIERIYVAFRALSMDAVTVSVTRDAASTFDANFRLLPANNGSYGRIIDRTFASSTGIPTVSV